MTNDKVTIEGRNMVFEALKFSDRVESVNIAEYARREPKIKEIEAICQQKKIKVQYMSGEQLEKLADSKGTQGVMARMNLPNLLTIKELISQKKDALILIYNRIDYEQNLGAIIRSAWASGVDLIICSTDGVHEVSNVVAKVSMGGAAFVPVIGMSMFGALDELKRLAVPIVGVEVNMGEIYTEANLTGPRAFLLGGEAVSISKPQMKYCDQMLQIPMASQIGSLNLSVATALILFERMRQKRK